MKRLKKSVFPGPFLLLLFIGFVLEGDRAYAAQDATISEMTADVYEAPDEESAVLETRKEGERVRVSDKDKDGWHKVKLKRPRDGFTYGWIHKDSLKFGGGKKSKKESSARTNYHPEDKSFSVMAVYDVPVSAASVELGMNLGSDWRLSARAGVTEYKQTATGTGISYEVTGRDIFALGEYMVLYGAKYRLGIAAGLGVSMGTTLKDKTILGNPVSSSFQAMGGIGKGTIRYFLGESIALHGEVGFRYLTKSNVVVGGNIVNLTLNSVLGAIGLAIEF
jgi:hypothetical protein